MPVFHAFTTHLRFERSPLHVVEAIVFTRG